MENLYFKNPRLLALTLILILVSGFASLQLLPRTEDPELTSRNAVIFTSFPGASAERVEALVTRRVEDGLSEFEEIKELTSTSRDGQSSVSIELADSIDNVDEVWSRIRDELADIETELPPGADAPDFDEFTITAFTLIVGVTWDLPSEPNHAVLGRLAEDLADVLRAVPGTRDVELFGEVEEEIVVTIDAGKLATYGLTALDISNAVRNADSKVTAGRIRTSTGEILIEVDGALDTLERVRNIPILANAQGHFLKLSDFGDVRKAHVAPRVDLAVLSGSPGVAIAARMQSGQRIDHWMQTARACLAEFEARVPRGVRANVLFDQSGYTERRLGDLFRNFILGAGLVMLVIFFTMGWRSALLVGIALPLTSLMVLSGLRFLGIPLNQMSVAGLIIALGLLIDNAIVMVDEVRHRLLETGDRARATALAVRALAVPLLGSTLTTALAFMPIVLMPGGAGEFVGSMAVSVILAITSSLFVSLTVTAAFAGRFEHVERSSDKARFWRTGLTFPELAGSYERLMGYLVARPILAIGVASILPVIGFAKFGNLKEQFFPPADRDQFALELSLPRQASIAETQAATERASAVLRKHPRVADVHWFVGESAPKFYYNLIDSERSANNYAQALVQLDGAENATAVLRELQVRLDIALPKTQVLVKQLEQGPPFDAPVELYLYGPDLFELHRLGETVRLELSKIPGVTHSRSTLVSGQPKLTFQLDEEKARLLGLDNLAIAGVLRASLDGTLGGSFLEATEELPVRARVLDRGHMQAISALEIPTDGGWTPLAALGSWSLEPNLASIPHRDSARSNAVQAFIEAGRLPNEILDELQRRLAVSRFDLPAGYRLDVGGEAKQRDDAVGNLAATAGVLLVLMAASLVLSFNSFRLAIMIGVVGLLSVGLSLLALWLFDYPFGFMAIVGTMGLVGVAINDSIVVLAALQADPGASRGDLDATVAVTMRSTRHVLSTSMTTMAGFTPLLLQGGGFWPPLAVAIGGGVMGATLIALTLVPSAYLFIRCRECARLAPIERLLGVTTSPA